MVDRTASRPAGASASQHIILIYAPPWKLAEPGNRYPPEEAAPAGFNPDTVHLGDYLQAPYGMLSLAAQLLHAGMHVSVFNLSDCPWSRVEQLVNRLEAGLYGLSCLTANRRGTAMLAHLIRRVHPLAGIIVGGPHVSALPLETLEHWPEIDAVVIGEGEGTFLEIADRWRSGAGIEGVSGTAWRSGGNCRRGSPRRFIPDLDALVSPLEYFDLGTLLTARGCPMRCTFCSSRMMWGGRARFHSVAYVLDMLEMAVCRHGRKIIAIKDDTFTADRRRALAICRGIRRRGLDFVWSCETRADCLDEELLRAMRMAGCKRISIGVESASEEILGNIRKQITPDLVFEVTQLIKRFGIQTRYYMMVGNRGETYTTFQESLEFIKKAKPNQYVFSQLHLYPGTEEFDIFRAHGLVDPEIFFSRNFFCLTVFAGSVVEERKIRACLEPMQGVQECWHYGADDYARIAGRLPEMASMHMDICSAYLREGDPKAARNQLDRAIALGYVLPGRILNARACLAAARNDIDAAAACLEKALHIYPHGEVLENIERLREWRRRGGDLSNEPLKLICNDHFEPARICHAPEHPGDLSLSSLASMSAIG